MADHAADNFMDQASAGNLWMGRANNLVLALEQRHCAQVIERDELRSQPIVKIVIVVRDLIGDVGDLRLKRRLLAFDETLTEFAELARIVERTMFENAFTGLESQIQARKGGVPLFQYIHHAQRLQVVLESTERPHAIIQRVLARVPKRRVTQIVRQANGFDQRFVELERPSDRARDLRDLDTVRETRAVEIPFMIDENLGLVDQPPKRIRMNDAIAISLEFAAKSRGRFGKPTSARVLIVSGIGRQRVREDCVTHLRRSRDAGQEFERCVAH
jgi:hypothetical protein